MKLKLKFTTGGMYDNSQSLRQRLGSDQPLKRSSSSASPDPDSVSITIAQREILLVFHFSDTGLSDQSINDWVNSVENNLLNATEMNRDIVS